MNSISKASLIAAGLVLIGSMAACSPADSNTYNGVATVQDVLVSKLSCTVRVELADKSQQYLHPGPDLTCFGLNAGDKVTVKSGELTT